MRLYLGNLPWKITEQDIIALFEKYDIMSSDSVRIIRDRETGRSKGYGFIDVRQGSLAIEDMDGSDVQGRCLKVNEALRTRPQQSSRQYDNNNF